MLRMNELFSGIGSQTKALQRAGVDHVITGISEIDVPAIRSYTAIYGDTYNYGDISKVDRLKQADFWTYSFPCTDISKAGKMEGITESTRSGLILQVERLLREAHEKGELPMYLMLENVATLASKRFKGFLDGWIQFLSDLGYDTKYKVINASTQGIPQNRDRIIAVSKLRAGGGLHNFEFPQNVPLRVSLDEIIEKNVDDRYYVDLEKYKDIISIVNGKIRVASKYGFPVKPTQIIQPYEFGEPHKKTTCLWLKGVPMLEPTKIVEPELESYICKNGKKVTFSKDFNKTGKDRAKNRSKTYIGVAKAMAKQWGDAL